jgi:quercetin dioxygenase-like cupin family protein
MSEQQPPPLTVVQISETEAIPRGPGIASYPLITPQSRPGAALTSGISEYAAGTGAPAHSHNCDEQVTILAGAAEVETDGERQQLSQYDTTYIQAGQIHAFRNSGEDVLRILWIYASPTVTRTFSHSGETVVHLSSADSLDLS